MTEIEAANGVTIVQEPDASDAPHMPLHVLKNDSPRYIVKASEIESPLWRLVVGDT